jgi:molybdopterin molybdotransferase
MVGCSRPLVAKRPRVAVLATGNELVPVDRIADALQGRAIIDSNSPAACAALRAASCEPQPLGIARDDLADLRQRIRQGCNADALVTTAGASVGDHDLVKDALEEAGCHTLFWRVRLRPGSPASFGLIPRPGRPPLPVFGLPGNPVSVMVTLLVLVLPALRRMQGRTAVFPRTVPVVAGEEIRSPAGLVRFLRVRLDRTGAGPARAHLTGPQGSGILTSVAAADALLVVPEDVGTLAAGDAARAVLLGGADEGDEELLF